MANKLGIGFLLRNLFCFGVYQFPYNSYVELIRYWFFGKLVFSFGDWIFTLLLKVIQQPVPALHHTIMQSLTSLINALFPKIPCGDVQQIIDASGDHFHQSHIESFEWYGTGWHKRTGWVCRIISTGPVVHIH